ncbi:MULTISPECIES: chaperone modulator CbpM [Chryseobacterium group]|uniref:Chaperone modulator CbpM n=1 Tax=Kaistella yananensis TaxID=2989820 RepID=A0ABT3JKP8_9FLAO|nr:MULTISPECIES: chaperone modulator CbpM [Chryseobacterium group]MCW4451358.1 chaperone modulator CbpM [Kaistella yananensis]OWR12984.1 MerR family transcriptional regulator [Chryseobacterium sp. VAUSW3]
MSERISREELVKIYNIEITFFDSLEEAGLLKTVTENEVKYLLYDELELFERFANWHYDLDVNLPGVEVIHHLLQKMEKLTAENRRLLQHMGSDSY